MPANESLERLIGVLNEIYPDIHLQRADYSSYIIKNVSPSDCHYSIRNEGSNQYHIAVTGADRMSVFPLITDYKYLSTRDPAFKHKFTFKCPLVLYLPNMISKASRIAEAYTDLAAAMALKQERVFYEHLQDQLSAELGSSLFKKTSCNIAYNERGTGQKQLEIGRSDDDRYFLTFRTLLFPNDKLIILKRANQVEYLFLLLQDDIFQAHNLNEIDQDVEIPTIERISLQTLASAMVEAAEATGAGTETANPGAVEESGVEYAWYVGAKWGDEDKTNEFIENGTWVNGWDDKFKEDVNSVQVGDRIAIKAVFTRKRDLPFDNKGKTMSCVQIKAIGVVTENLGDGKNLKVKWERCDPFKMWYIFGGWMRSTIHLVRSETSWKHRALLNFTFGDSEQDYGAFLEVLPLTATEAGIEPELIDDPEGGAESDEVELQEYFPVVMKPEQIIFFGAPGTGKSFDINEKIKAFYAEPEVRAAHCTRVTFYPDYEYSDFVGALRPVRHPTNGLDYEFIPGPMTRILTECFKHPSEVFFLIIEEINRGNAPAIFGDLFQLLDRVAASGKSIYEINNEEVAAVLQKETNYLNTFSGKKIWFPSNLSILCSMNTADQNVFVLDTAFSRRFERVYVRIDFNRLATLEAGAKKEAYTTEIPLFAGNKPLKEVFSDTDLSEAVDDLDAKGLLLRNWPTFAILVNRLIDLINDQDGTDQISEDKKLGPFFASETDLSSRVAFLNKVVYYLKQDVFRYVEQYFNAPFQTIFDQYVNGGDLFALLKMSE